jgi:hypothetical protein
MNIIEYLLDIYKKHKRKKAEKKALKIADLWMKEAQKILDIWIKYGNRNT